MMKTKKMWGLIAIVTCNTFATWAVIELLECNIVQALIIAWVLVTASILKDSLYGVALQSMPYKRIVGL
jgi:dolichol kinase